VDCRDDPDPQAESAAPVHEYWNSPLPSSPVGTRSQAASASSVAAAATLDVAVIVTMPHRNDRTGAKCRTCRTAAPA
jgi:hypothetical protein